jgi:hypothetical protein
VALVGTVRRTFTDCRPAQFDALLEAAGFPTATLQTLQSVDGGADFAAFADSIRDMARRELAASGDTARGRDPLLRRSARVGITEVESARLTGLSRTTVRKALGKEVLRQPPTIAPVGREGAAGAAAPATLEPRAKEAPFPCRAAP